jgi:hypothetical protein
MVAQTPLTTFNGLVVQQIPGGVCVDVDFRKRNPSDPAVNWPGNVSFAGAGSNTVVLS